MGAGHTFRSVHFMSSSIPLRQRQSEPAQLKSNYMTPARQPGETYITLNGTEAHRHQGIPGKKKRGSRSVQATPTKSKAPPTAPPGCIGNGGRGLRRGIPDQELLRAAAASAASPARIGSAYPAAMCPSRSGDGKSRPRQEVAVPSRLRSSAASQRGFGTPVRHDSGTGSSAP